MSKKAPARLRLDFRALADEFRHLDPRDPGAWPAAPRMAAHLFVLAAILAAGWFLVWNERLEQLAAREEEEKSLRQQYLVKKRQAVNLELYRQQLGDIDRSFGTLLRQLPSKSEMEALLVEVNQAGLGRGLQFELFKPGQEQVRDFYAELPVTVRILGNYHELGAFAEDIARLPRIVTLNNIAISTAPGGQLALDAVARTFRYLDEEEMARRRKAAQGAGR